MGTDNGDTLVRDTIGVFDKEKLWLYFNVKQDSEYEFPREHS
jgi:hypothetical protein